MTMTQAPPPMGVASMASLLVNVVKLVNEGHETFNKRYGPHDRLIIEPGAEVFVTEEVAWHFLGRWWANNSNPRFRERVEEVRRLRVFYGAYEDDVLWERMKPRISAYTSDGARIATVVDDPEGLEQGGGQTRLGMEQSHEAQIEFLQRQILDLTARMDRANQQAANENQAPIRADEAPATMPAGPTTPGPKLSDAFAAVPGVGAVPIAPSNIEAEIDAAVGDLPGTRLPVATEVLDIDVDSPQRPPVGPRRVGHPEIKE